MRIIAGISGGIPLRVPKGVTRPTADRVRESLFAVLGNRVEGARVLDLFAGSGALGLEALSRGAAHATFVERNRPAAETLLENLKKARLGDMATLQVRDALAVAKNLSTSDYDLVFADPPYAKRKGDRDFASALLKCAPLADSLKDEGLLVLETESRHLDAPAPWQLTDSRVYGSTAIHFLSTP